MSYLFYTHYRSGNAGLSNGIMSVEIGVILAHLTNRLLVLDGNVPPPANIVSYDRRVDNERRSRITDLVDIPVAWVEPDAVDLHRLESLELTDRSLMDLVFYFPKMLDISTSDAKSFARDRKHWVTVTGEHERVPVLRVSEDPIPPRDEEHRNNLGFYSYQFYLDHELRRSVYRLMQRMQAKAPYAELAKRVARDLGPFNAVHLRRGDFKVTYGVTTLDRQPFEAVEAMDQLFGRQEPLVILTDERDDPFFSEIKFAYPKHCFIDWHILDHYGAEFSKLPQTDSLSLAYLSQLVAAESKEFIGTMTSTFTALIQRYRGNRGKNEVFRYLWNELPDSDIEIERGRHAVGQCIPLDRGRMVEELPGPYTWNRVSQLLNPSWMREWPESFLLPEIIETGALKTQPRVEKASSIQAYSTSAARQPVVYVTFDDLQVAVWSKDAALLRRLAPDWGAQPNTEAQNVLMNFEVSATGDTCSIQERGRSEKTSCDRAQLSVMLKQQIGRVFALARNKYAWLVGAAFAKGGRGMVITGEANDPSESFRRTLRAKGWEHIDESLFAIRLDDFTVVPMGALSQAEAAKVKSARTETPLERLVITKTIPLYAKNAPLAPLSPATAVAALIGSSLDFQIDRERGVNGLCRIVEKCATAQLHFGDPQKAAQALLQWANTSLEVAA